MDIYTTLRSRFPAPDHRISDLKTKFDLANTFLPVIKTWRKEAASNKHLSEAGAASAYRKRLDKEVMREVREMDRLIAESKTNLVAARKKACLPVFDPSDIVSALHRREVREFLRSLDIKERLELLLVQGDDPIYIEAALELHPALSGLPADQAEHVREKYAETYNPEVMEHIHLREAALEVMTAFSSAFKAEVREQAGLETVGGIGRASAFDTWYQTGAEPEAEK